MDSRLVISVSIIFTILMMFSIFTVYTSAQSNPIPVWIKDTIRWWSEGAVSDTEFLNALQYLVNNGIITMSQKSEFLDEGNYNTVESSSYIIFTDGKNIFAKNTTTGLIEFSGTDASTVIQNAIDSTRSNQYRAGGKILFKSGTYTISSTIEPRGGVTLEGENKVSTQLRLADGVNVDMFRWTGAHKTEFFPIWRNLELDGNKDHNESGSGIVVENVGGHHLSDGYIEHMFIRNFAEHGVHLKFDWGWKLNNNVIEYNHESGALLQGSGTQILNNRFLSNDFHGLQLSGGEFLIVGNQFRDNGQNGIRSGGGGTGTVLMANYFHNNGHSTNNTYDQISVELSGQMKIIGNSFNGNNESRYGIKIRADADELLIQGNSFINHISGAISDDSKNSLIKDNFGNGENIGSVLPTETVEPKFPKLTESQSQFGNEERVVATIGEDFVKVYDLEDNSQIIFASETSDVVFNHQGTKVAAIGDMGVKVYDLEHGTRIIYDKDASKVVFNSQGTMIATIGDEAVQIYDTQDGSLKIHASETSDVVFNAQGNIVASLGDNFVKIYDIEEEKEIIFASETSDVVFNAQGNIVAALGDNFVKIYDIEQQKEIIFSGETAKAEFNIQNPRLYRYD